MQWSQASSFLVNNAKLRTVQGPYSYSADRDINFESLLLHVRKCLVPPKNFRPITSDVWAHAWSIKCRQKITNYTDCDKFVRRIF
jgi:hypothetical protein